MGSLALSRVDVLDQPAPSIAGEVARIAREQLAPLAAGIDDGSVYPAEVLREFGAVGAWGSHMPHEGPADLRCAIQAMAAIGEVCAPRRSWPGARTRWSGTPPTPPI
ncbi:alkylation response protein AidB-like acyl-CoA dehydrogenase [Bradyrhizobium diazoefficiens]